MDARQDSEEEGSLFNRGTQVNMFEEREEYLLSSVARRLQGKSKEMSAFDAFNAVQDHVLHAASAHIDRIVLEAFVAGIDACEDDEARELLGSGVRPVRAVGDRGGQGVVHRAPVPVHRAGQGRHPRDQRTMPRRCARTPRRWSTVSASRSRCATPRCCTRRICRLSRRESRAQRVGRRWAILVRDLAERLQLAVRSDLELHRAVPVGQQG